MDVQKEWMTLIHMMQKALTPLQFENAKRTLWWVGEMGLVFNGSDGADEEWARIYASSVDNFMRLIESLARQSVDLKAPNVREFVVFMIHREVLRQKVVSRTNYVVEAVEDILASRLLSRANRLRLDRQAGISFEE